MVTTVARPDRQTETEVGAGFGRCAGCPRCEHPSVPLCSSRHPQFSGLHPVCKVCSHCVLRGEHLDDASDLDDYNSRPNPPPREPLHSRN